jgi:hypothetical protein
MSAGGSYRIDDEEFDAPETAWAENPIVDGLNILPVNESYRQHTWSWSGMLGCDLERLVALFESQQDGNAQLTELETDPYDVTGADQKYGTVVYTDFVITALSPRARGLPHYDNVQVTFQVYAP